MSCRFPNAASQHFAREAAKTIDAQSNVQPVRADIHALDQQRHDARLLGGEEFVPQRVELLECRAGVGFGDAVGVGTRRLPGSRNNLRLPKHGAKLVDDGDLNLACGHATNRTRPSSMLQHRLADIVAVQTPALAGVGRREGCAIGPKQQPLQQRGRVGAGARGALARAFLQDGVNLVPCFTVDDGVMLAGIALPLVDRLADVGAVRQHPVEVLLVDPVAAWGADAAVADLARQFCGRADLQEPGEDPAHMIGDLIDYHQLPVLDPVSVGRNPAHPHAFAPRGGDLVADALGRHLALELGEGKQDVQRQPAHGRGGVERLRHRDEGHAVPVEHLDQFGEVGQRPRQSVDLVDHHHVDQTVLDVLQQPLQSGAFQRAAGDAAVVILIANQHPALGALAGDVRLAGLSLGVQAVEFLFQPFLGGFSGVDRTAQLADDLRFLGRLRHVRPLWFLSPKNTQPFQRVPVIARAMADSDLYGRPCHSKPSAVTVTICSLPCHSRRRRVPVIGWSRTELGRVFLRLFRNNVKFQGFSDHLVSEAIYLADPDENGVELYADKPRSEWVNNMGQIMMDTLPLDLSLITAGIDENEQWRGIHPAADIGHIHLNVSDLQKAQKFYSLLLGMNVTNSMYNGALFFSAGGYHHHIGTNIWSSRNGSPAPENTAGLLKYTINIPDENYLNELEKRYSEAGLTASQLKNGEFEVLDFDKIKIKLTL